MPATCWALPQEFPVVPTAQQQDLDTTPLCQKRPLKQYFYAGLPEGGIAQRHISAVG